VFAVLMSMSEGFPRPPALDRPRGQRDRRPARLRSELTSAVPLDQRNQIVVDDRVARGADGQPLAWDGCRDRCRS
jgi:hypothetical protein